MTTSGIASYNRAFDIFEPLHDKKFRILRTADFQSVIDMHMQKTHSTVSKYKQLITQMSRWAIREEIITTDFAKYVTLPDSIKQDKEIFTEAEMQKLERDGSEAARIVLMLLATGMRIGELFALNVSDFYGEYVIGGEKTEAGRNRIIPIRPEGIKHFEYFVKQATGNQLLSGYVGNKSAPQYRKRDYYPLLDRLGIARKTPHSTRHTYSTRAVKEGMKPEYLQQILGHVDYSTTANIYTHIDADELVNAVKKL